MGCDGSKVAADPRVKAYGQPPRGAPLCCFARRPVSPPCSTVRTYQVVPQPLSTVPWTASEGDSSSCAGTEDLEELIDRVTRSVDA